MTLFRLSGHLVFSPGTLAALTLFTLAALPQTAQAQPALDFTGGHSASPGNNQTLGWEFTLLQARTVTALGAFDIGSNGFSENHLVGIWTTSGTLLGQVTVTSASTALASISGVGNWRFQNLGAPIALPSGNYIVGMDFVTPNDQVYTQAGGLTTDPSLVFVRGRFASSATAGFDFPNGSFSTSGGHFGANLILGSGSSAPEPGTLALLALGMVGGVVVRRRK